MPHLQIYRFYDGDYEEYVPDMWVYPHDGILLMQSPDGRGGLYGLNMRAASDRSLDRKYALERSIFHLFNSDDFIEMNLPKSMANAKNWHLMYSEDEHDSVMNFDREISAEEAAMLRVLAAALVNPTGLKAAMEWSPISHYPAGVWEALTAVVKNPIHV